MKRTRVAPGAMQRFVTTRGWSVQTLAYVFGSTTSNYQKWARKNGLDILTDEIGEGGKLHWIGPLGPRKFDRVLLFFHGGGYALPLNIFTQLAFLLSVKRDLEESVGGIGVVFLEYFLMPDFPFPTQLRQANAAVIHLDNGLTPSSLVLSGDSAGGGITFQILSHILHPLPDIPPPPRLSTAIGGAALISPWISFDSTLPSYAKNDKLDIVPTEFYDNEAAIFLSDVPDSHRAYAEPLFAGATWWEGLGSVVGRVFASAGELECPRNSILKFFSGPVKEHVLDTTVILDKGGLHEDMLNAFPAREGGRSTEYRILMK
ncbi:alpha/beta-hydrolase [Artomyces pyxidatus]|uniref:Alpha/beta-hydrolase n=1 Tax=Artomyces pyxidatus TaxID=48021 RepID=A0ACB8SWQ5_9AGAM|nr:alpha/beta-hydrolase [Artomyces pyxidatus]